ncbi:MAG: allantoate deiminase [Bacillota bacterium]|nr:allantoate deiminase [Bacillota bacterium]
MEIIEQIKHYEKILSAYGALEGGGLTRLLYTDEWLECQKRLKEEMEKLGMKAAFDEVGNLFGLIEGSEEGVVSTGSHIDTVVRGGNLDGQFGIVGGLVAIKNLLEKYGRPKKSLQLISLAEEEGSRFPTVFWGSKNVLGLQDNEAVKDIKDSEGLNFVNEMHRCGFDFKKDSKAREVGSFVELHIEQGNLLEKLNKEIGVINAITGQKRYRVKLRGQANHAGTTRMEYRKDAAYGYALIVKAAIEKAIEMDPILVCTFGSVELIPNTVNVVPGECNFSIDCRHPQGQVLDEFASWLEETMVQIAEEKGLEIEIDKWMDERPVPMDEKMIALLENTAKDLGLNYELMHSGAGHDSQIFAEKVPTAMIFVPSIGGISHNINEATAYEDQARGCLLLENALYKLSY